MVYIGFTGQDAGVRLADHIMSATSKGSDAQMVQACIAENDFDFSHKYIGAYLDEKEALVEEIRAIAKVAKSKRLNNTPGGEGITMNVKLEGRKYITEDKVAPVKKVSAIKYNIVGGWLKTPMGSTKFFNDKDLAFLEAGGQPAIQKSSGFMILPYGHGSGKRMYDFAFALPVPK